MFKLKFRLPGWTKKDLNGKPVIKQRGVVDHPPRNGQAYSENMIWVTPEGKQTGFVKGEHMILIGDSFILECLGCPGGMTVPGPMAIVGDPDLYYFADNGKWHQKPGTDWQMMHSPLRGQMFCPFCWTRGEKSNLRYLRPGTKVMLHYRQGYQSAEDERAGRPAWGQWFAERMEW